MSERKLVAVCVADIPLKVVRMVCPRCYGDTATGWCPTCGIDWADGLSDWLIRPNKNTFEDVALDLLGVTGDEPQRRNPKWRKQWRRRGVLRCSWCDVT